jgi:hypothetical protein
MQLESYHTHVSAQRHCRPPHPSGFDRELPPEAKNELITPKRPRILGPQKPVASEPVPRKWPFLSAFFVLLIVAGICTTLRHQDRSISPSIPPSVSPTPQKEERTPAPVISKPAPAPILQATPSEPLAPEPSLPLNLVAPEPTATSGTPSSQAPATPEVRRAKLVRLPDLPAPRAVRILHAGDQAPVMMPYRIEVLATIKGYAPSLDQLPLTGNHVGDLWVVGTERTPWVWITAPGATHADWIDP